MKKPLLILLALIVLSGHDMYLKLDGYFLEPSTDATVDLFNGTFARSDNTIDRDRMLDVSLLAAGQRRQLDTSQWSDEGNTTKLSLTTGEPGTYVVGVSTRARNIEMEADAFNNYLEHDGVVDMLAARRESGKDSEDANEKYSKHVKTIFQVGDEHTDDWSKPLGYPIEFVPLSNPYELHAGDSLSVRLLRDGKPLAGQLVLVDSEAPGHTHTHREGHDHEDGDHTHAAALEARTDDDGILRFEVANDGSWFIRTIHMVETEEEGLTHESNWATLTFGVDHGHSHAGGHAHSHDHAHSHEHGIPSYVYWAGSLLLVGGLFVYFKRQ